MSDMALHVTAGLEASATGAAERVFARPELTAEVLPGVAAYRELSADWQRLSELQRSPVPFQTPELLALWSRHFAAAKPSPLATVVVRRDDGRAVLIWPLSVERKGLVRIARGAGTPVGQYDEFLLDPEYDVRAALAAATAALARTARPDLIVLERVRADSALYAAISPLAPATDPEGAPFADLSAGSEALLKTLKSRVIQQQKKRVRRFHQEGEVGFELAADAAQAESWLMEAMRIKREWLRATGRFSRAFAKCEMVDLFADYARVLSDPAASPRMLVSRLTLDGRTAAVEVGFVHRSTYHLYLGAFSPDLAKFGPGNILTEKLLHWCAENGVTRYDMLSPRSRNKSEWQSGEVEVFDFALPTTPLGRLHLATVVQRLEPLARQTFYRLPDGVRAKLAGFMLRRIERKLRALNRVSGVEA